MAFYGLMFLIGWPLAFVDGLKVAWGAVVAWLVVGGGLSWYFVAKPALTWFRLWRAPVQSIWVEVSDAGITARVADSEPVLRYWGELVGLLEAPRGFALGFRDGTICWLPERVFANSTVRAELAAFMKSKLPTAEHGA